MEGVLHTKNETEQKAVQCGRVFPVMMMMRACSIRWEREIDSSQELREE